MITLKVKHLTGKNRTLGLIGAKKAYPVFFQTRFGIHTFGVGFPIDILILNADNKVVATKRNLMPNRIFLWNPKFKNVIELPQDEIDIKKIKIGDRIQIVNTK